MALEWHEDHPLPREKWAWNHWPQGADRRFTTTAVHLYVRPTGSFGVIFPSGPDGTRHACGLDDAEPVGLPALLSHIERVVHEHEQNNLQADIVVDWALEAARDNGLPVTV